VLAFDWRSALDGRNIYIAFGWRSASSAAMNALLPLTGALAPRLPETQNLIPRQKLIHNRGRAALQRRVSSCESSRALAPDYELRTPEPETTRNYERTMNPCCGKPVHDRGIKPVIVEDTTYGVSLLTGTISGSSFAIP